MKSTDNTVVVDQWLVTPCPSFRLPFGANHGYSPPGRVAHPWRAADLYMENLYGW